MWRAMHRLMKSTRAAIAPTVALSLFALIGMGGIAFDYAHLATLDTELQQAADHAALAAATQLDRSDGAQARAAAAVQNPVATRLAANITRFANDGSDSGRTVEISSITFCSEFDDAIPSTDAACTETEEDGDSAFVIVTTELRTANFAFTPIVAAFSGTISASAVAGVQSSICNVAPLLVCAPNNSFPTNEDIGKGIIMKVAGGSSWAPGNYGFLDFGAGNPAVIDALMGFGLNGCQNTDDNETEPGNKNATDAINTRFDVYEGTGATNNPSACDLSTGSGCPALNTRKDMTLLMTFKKRQAGADPPPTAASVPSCGAPAGGSVNDTGEVSYETDFALNPAAKGFPRDTCHYGGTCTGGNFGNASWDRDAYMAANHPGIDASTVATAQGKTVDKLTRYDVYVWELANEPSGKMNPVEIGVMPPPVVTGGGQKTYTFERKCNFAKPKLAPGAYPAQKDRRILPIVAADCTNLKGKGAAFEDYVLLRAFDIFLTEPSLDRTTPGVTENKEIYGEVVGPAETFAGTTGFQYYSRNRPYLIR